MIAYLSGAIEYSHDEGEGWRNNITEWLASKLHHSVINPVEESRLIISNTDSHDYRNWKETDLERYKNFINKFVLRDIKAVTKEANYIICLWNKEVFKGAGTHGEVTLAFEHGIPVYVVNQVPLTDLSGWIIACSAEVFKNFEELKLFLLRKFG
ncbi:MAG: hypothetical protein ACJZ1O_03815 [Candidatus Neomarinimicrobiota bacterium]|nr:MAG: hypothetical protein EVA23_00585 [bacterium]|tara:strand:+ start:282 stop:743 length:462 start_codon:yes stop_codon:yes gene_type:complete